MRPCFQFVAAKAESQPETLSIYDEIGFWGVQAKDFRASLGAVKSQVLNVEINSPGGDMFAGIAIYNMLRASGKTIHTKVMGVAASAASVIAMAGDKIIMPKNSMMMVHNPWTVVAGNADELRDTADTLDKMGISLMSTYVNKTGLPEEEVQALLAVDTWLTADEALEKGFATELADEIKVNAKFDLARADLPEKVRAALGLVKAQDPVDPVDPADPVDPVDPAEDEAPIADQVSALAVAAGLKDFEGVFALNCTTVAEAKTRIASAREIKSICAKVQLPDAAAAFIKSNTPVAEARASLLKTMAEADDETPIDTTPRSKQTTGSAMPKVINTASIWALHNAQRASKKGA